MKHLLILTLALPLLVCCQKQSKTKERYQEAIEMSSTLIDSLMQANKVPGVDIAIALDGDIIWSQGFGFSDLEQQVPVKAGETLFRIGSVSKPLSVAALGLLMDEGKVNVNAEVQEYVTYFPEKKYPLSVKQVGGHLAGIRHYRGDEFLSSTYYPTVKEGIAIFQDDALLFEPGTDYSYSSYGFNLLSGVIEEAAEKPFLEYMVENVFKPLAMNDTYADINHKIIPNRTRFYETQDGEVQNAPYVDNSYKWAGGGYISTTHDLIKFGEAHMSPGFLSEATWSEIMTTQVTTTGDTTDYGIGWVTTLHEENKMIGHTGGSVGGITQFIIYPEEKLILVMLSNSSNTRYGNVPYRIIDLFLADLLKVF